MHASQTEARKATKKSTSHTNGNNSNLQWGVGKQTSPVRSDKKNIKSSSCAETKKSNTNKNTGQNAENSVDSSKANANNKIGARFNGVPINQRKLQRCTKRREGTSKIGEYLWYASILVGLSRRCTTKALSIDAPTFTEGDGG